MILVPRPDEEVACRPADLPAVHPGEPHGARDRRDPQRRRASSTDRGRPWTRGTVHQVLTNEKYIGNNVYNRVSFKLKKKRVGNPPDMWVRRDGAFEPIVSPEDFYTAQGIILARARRLTDDEMLERLRGLLAKHSLLVQRS